MNGNKSLFSQPSRHGKQVETMRTKNRAGFWLAVRTPKGFQLNLYLHSADAGENTLNATFSAYLWSSH